MPSINQEYVKEKKTAIQLVLQAIAKLEYSRGALKGDAMLDKTLSACYDYQNSLTNALRDWQRNIG